MGDVNIVARGVNAMLKEEKQEIRRTEFLAATNNPADLEIIGMEGRRELLREVAEGIDLEGLAKVLPEIDEIDGLRQELEQIVMQQSQQMAESVGGVSPMAKSPATDQAGNVQSGQESRLFPQSAMELPR